MMLATSGMNRRAVWGFALYDFANSAFILIFNSFLFPIYFREYVFSGNPRADLYWGITLGVSVAVALLLGPLVGHIADRWERRKTLGISVAVTSCGMLCLAILPPDLVWTITGVFAATNASYVLSLTLYDSLLPHIAPREKRSLVSGFAWGFGYIGGVICIALVYGLQGGSLEPGLVGFLATAVFYAGSGGLSLILLPKLPKRESAERLFEKIRTHITPSILLLLVAFWLVNGAIDIAIYFTSIFASTTLSLSTNTVGALLLGMQVVAFPATCVVAYLATRRGERKVLNGTFFIWGGIALGFVFARSMSHFALIALATAFVIGSSQSLMRSYFSNQMPEAVSGVSFGFYSVVARSSALFAPALFGIVSSAFGSQRLAMLLILPLVVFGSILLMLYRGTGGSCKAKLQSNG